MLLDASNTVPGVLHPAGHPNKKERSFYFIIGRAGCSIRALTPDSRRKGGYSLPQTHVQAGNGAAAGASAGVFPVV